MCHAQHAYDRNYNSHLIGFGDVNHNMHSKDLRFKYPLSHDFSNILHTKYPFITWLQQQCSPLWRWRAGVSRAAKDSRKQRAHFLHDVRVLGGEIMHVKLVAALTDAVEQLRPALSGRLDVVRRTRTRAVAADKLVPQTVVFLDG